MPKEIILSFQEIAVQIGFKNMIEYIYKTNIDDKVMQKTREILVAGGIVAYPTDTSWGLGCSINSKKGIEKLRRLKGTFKNDTLTMICSSISQISDVCFFTNNNFKLIKKLTPGPYVFILPAKAKIEKKMNIARIEIGVRIPDHPVPIRIVENINSPIFSITASKKMTEKGWWDKNYAEENLFECGWELEMIQGIDLILDTGETLNKSLSTVIDLTEQDMRVIRTGIGDIS